MPSLTLAVLGNEGVQIVCVFVYVCLRERVWVSVHVWHYESVNHWEGTWKKILHVSLSASAGTSDRSPCLGDRGEHPPVLFTRVVIWYVKGFHRRNPKNREGVNSQPQVITFLWGKDPHVKLFFINCSIIPHHYKNPCKMFSPWLNREFS